MSPQVDRQRGVFEEYYRSQKEPYQYSERAADLLRHERVAELVKQLQPQHLLEVGCSLGLLTRQLLKASRRVTALDLSPTAIVRARAAFATESVQPELLVGSVLALPVARGSFDVVVASDGPHSWYLDHAERVRAYGQLHDVLVPGGFVIITEYRRPNQLTEFVAEIAATRLEIVSVNYLYDRLWYKLAGFARALARDVTLARIVCRASRMLGVSAVHHIVVVAKRSG